MIFKKNGVLFNMLIANFPKYFNNSTDCAFHKFAFIAPFYADCVVCADHAFRNFFRGKFESSQHHERLVITLID